MTVKWTGLPARGSSLGFTLIELLLALTLMLMFAGAVVFSFSTLLRGRELEDGAAQMDSVLRFARAHAANTGRKVQLVFEDADPDMPIGIIRLIWEPDPLGQPGYFEDLTDAAWQIQQINGLVQVEEVKLLDGNGAYPSESLQSSESATEMAPPEPFSPITFYPDGSSDSAEIILASTDPEDEHRVSVRLAGLSGTIRHEVVSREIAESPNAAESER